MCYNNNYNNNNTVVIYALQRSKNEQKKLLRSFAGKKLKVSSGHPKSASESRRYRSGKFLQTSWNVFENNIKSHAFQQRKIYRSLKSVHNHNLERKHRFIDNLKAPSLMAHPTRVSHAFVANCCIIVYLVNYELYDTK